MSLDEPSGRSAPWAVPILVAACLGTGIGMGVVEGFVGQWINLLILFPALIGLAVGAAATGAVDVGRMRAPLLAGLIAFGGGAVGQITTHGMEYARFRRTIEAAMAEDPATAGATVEEALEAETGRRGFLAYLTIAAEKGITITRVAQSSRGPAFTGMGVWGFWGFEVLIAAAVAAWMSVTRAKEPFCESCDAWYDKDDTIAVGDPDKQSWAPLVAAADTGDWAPALVALGPPGPNGASVVHLLRCATCTNHRPVVVVMVVSAKGGQKEHARVQIAWESAVALMRTALIRAEAARVTQAVRRE